MSDSEPKTETETETHTHFLGFTSYDAIRCQETFGCSLCDARLIVDDRAGAQSSGTKWVIDTFMALPLDTTVHVRNVPRGTP